MDSQAYSESVRQYQEDQSLASTALWNYVALSITLASMLFIGLTAPMRVFD